MNYPLYRGGKMIVPKDFKKKMYNMINNSSDTTLPKLFLKLDKFTSCEQWNSKVILLVGLYEQDCSPIINYHLYEL